MKHLRLITPADQRYFDILKFVQPIYKRDLSVTIDHLPPLVMTVFDDTDAIVGCMGLNTSVVSDLFTTNLAYQRHKRSLGAASKIVDQGLFAVNHCATAVPTLIAATAALAEALAFSHVVYAGIHVSCKAIDRLGLETTKIGPVEFNNLPTKTQQNVTRWHRLHDPQIFTIATKGAGAICQNFLRKHRSRICIGPYTHQVLFLQESAAA